MTVYADDLSMLKSIELDEDNLDLCARHFVRLIEDPLEHEAMRGALKVLNERGVDDERFATLSKELQGFETHWKQRILELESRARKVEVSNEEEAATLRTTMAAFQLAYGEFPESAHATLSHILTTLPELEAPWRVTVAAMRQADKLKELSGEVQNRIKLATTARVSIIWLKRLAGLNQGLGLDSSVVPIFREVLEADPGDVDANFALATYYKEHQQHFESVRILEDFLELVEDEASCLAALRMLCEILDRDLNDLPAASKHYESILEYEPADPQAIEALERHYRVVDDVEGLLGILSRRVQLGQAGDDEITELVHLSMDRLDRPDDAFRWLCEIYSAHPRPYLQTHLTRLADVVGQEDAAVDTLLRGIDAQRSDQERLSVTRSILGFVPKLREVPLQVMELASEAVKDHPSDETIGFYETTLIHYASQKEPKSFLETMEASAASSLERQCIARVWVAVMDYIPFTPDEWLARAQANVEVLGDDDDALEQLADGLKGRGDDQALAAVYRKRLEADIALKDESWLVDARDVFVRLGQDDALETLLDRWTSLEGAATIAWQWWAEESSPESDDLPKLSRAIEVLGAIDGSAELVSACRRIFELAPVTERGHFAATLIGSFPSPSEELCPPRFWLVAVTYLFESRAYDDALLRLAGQFQFESMDDRFLRELLDRSIQYAQLPLPWNQCLLMLAIESRSSEHLAFLLEDALSRAAEWNSSFSSGLATWFSQDPSDCEAWVVERAPKLVERAWDGELLKTSTEATEPTFRKLILELSLRSGANPVEAWRELLLEEQLEYDELAALFSIAIERLGDEAAVESLRQGWLEWLIAKGHYESGLEVGFAEPWPRAAEYRSTRWLKIAELRWHLGQDSESAEACQSAMSTGLSGQDQWSFIKEIQSWLSGSSERGWKVISAIFSTAASQLLSDAEHHDSFQRILQPMSHPFKAALYTYAAPVFRTYQFDAQWIESAEFLAVYAPELSEQEQWARKLVAHYDEGQQYERIIRLVGIGSLLERETSEDFPLVRRALGVEPSLAAFALEQLRIWRSKLSSELTSQLDRLELELRIHFIEDLPGATRLMQAFEGAPLEEEADWLIEARVELTKLDPALTLSLPLVQEWARRAVSILPEAVVSRWERAYQVTNDLDPEGGLAWLLEGAQLDVLTIDTALTLYARLGELDDTLYVQAARSLLNSLLPDEQKYELASRWLGRAKTLDDWESWRSAWSVLWGHAVLSWHSIESHLPEAGQAFDLLSDTALEFISSASQFDEPEKAKRWALYYLEGGSLKSEQVPVIDSFIETNVFSAPAAKLSLIAIRVRQPRIGLELLDTISGIAEEHELWGDAAKLLRGIELDNLVSGVAKSLVRRRAARFYDRAQNHEASLALWGDVLELEPGDQEATGVSIRLLSELGRFEELWSRLWPSIKYSVETPDFLSRLRVLDEILERGVSPDAQSAEFLLWRLDSVEPTMAILNTTLDWFRSRQLWTPYAELCRKALAEQRWVSLLGKEEHLELSIKLADALFRDPIKRPEALGLMTAVREVDVHRAGRSEFLETWSTEDLESAKWVLSLALELNRDELVRSAYLALLGKLVEPTDRTVWFEEAAAWTVQRQRQDVLVELFTLALKVDDEFETWRLLDWSEDYLRNLSADAQIWFWLVENLEAIEPVERRHKWIVIRAEQLLKRNVADPELWTVLHRDSSVLETEPRAVELALKSALARDARKEPLLLIESAIDSRAQGALTWANWYEHALVHGVEDDWLRVSSQALNQQDALTHEVLNKWLDIACHGVMTDEKRRLVWSLVDLEKLDAATCLSLMTRILDTEDLPFDEMTRAIRECIRFEGDSLRLLKDWAELLRSPHRDDTALEQLLAFWSQGDDRPSSVVATASLKFEFSRGQELEALGRYDCIELESAQFFSAEEVYRFGDLLITVGQTERGLFWDLVFRQRLTSGGRLTISGLMERLLPIEDKLLNNWLSGVMKLLDDSGRLDLCRALARQRRCEGFVVASLRKLLPRMERGTDEWFEVVQLSLLGARDLLSPEEETLLEAYLDLGGRDVRAVLSLADGLSRRADYRRCIDLLEEQLSSDWGADETSLLLALYDVYCRIESPHGAMSTLTRLLRTSPSDPAIHELLRDSVTSENFREVLAILEECTKLDVTAQGRGQLQLSIGYLARCFGEVEKARQGFDEARGCGLASALCLDVEHKAYVKIDDLRGVLRVQREYDPSQIESERLSGFITWWLRGKESGISLSNRDDGMVIQLLERQGTEFKLDGNLAARLLELEYYQGLSIYLEGIWMRTLEQADELESLVGWLEKIAKLSARFVPDDPKWWLRRFQSPPAWPDGVSRWAEISCENGRTDDFLELVEAEPEFHTEPYRVRVEIERAKIYLQIRERPDVAADILQFLCDDGNLDSPELNVLFETALLRSGRWEDWRNRLDQQIERLGSEEEKANLFIKAGELLYQQERRPELAEPFFLRALELRPESPDGLAALAKLYERSGNFFQAISMLERELGATESSARRVDVLNRMGRIQSEMLGDLPLARASYEKANALSPNDLESLDALRAIASQDERYEDYLKLLRLSLDSTDDVIDYIDISLEAVDVLIAQRPDTVLEILDSALRREENNVELKFKRTCLLDQQGTSDNVLEMWQALWPQAGFLLPRERAVVARKLALCHLEIQDYTKVCEYGRLALEFAEPGEAPIQALLTGLNELKLWSEVKTTARTALDALSAYPVESRAELSEFCVWSLGQANDELGEDSEAERHLKRSLLSQRWKVCALERLIALFRRSERFNELVLYARERLDQDDSQDTPHQTINVFVESMRALNRESEIFSPVLSWALRHPTWDLNEVLIAHAYSRDAKTQLVRYLERRFSSDDLTSHRGMLAAGKLYELEFKNESLAVKTYQEVLDANPANLDALELLESLLGRRSQWRRLGTVYLNLARALEGQGERARAMFLAKQTVELAQHALRRENLGLQAAKYLLGFESLTETDARLAYGVVASADEVDERREGIQLLSRSGYARETDYADYFNALEAIGEKRHYADRLRHDFGLVNGDQSGEFQNPLGHTLSDEDLRKALAHCLELPLGRFLRELWRIAPETLTRRLPSSYFQGDEVVTKQGGDGFVGDLQRIQKLLGASMLDVKLRPGSVEGARVLPIQPTTLLVGKASSLVRSEDRSARAFCLGRLIALTRPEVIVARIYPGHLLNDVVCGLLATLGVESAIPLNKRAKAWAEHFAKFGKSRFANLRPEAEALAPTLGLHRFEEYSQRVEEFALSVGLITCGDLRGAERGLAWVGDPVSSLSTDALRNRLHSFALSEHYSALRSRLWGES